MDLPVEVLLSVFDHLGFKDLISIASTNSFFRDLAEILVKQKTIRITNAFSLNKYIEEYNQLLELNFGPNFELTFRFLRIFGHRITTLVVDRFGNSNQRKLFQKHISKYVASYVKRIDFHFHDEINPLSDFDRPFEEAKIVTIRGYQISTTAAKLQDLFPVVSTLDVGSSPKFKHELMMNFPYLERMTIPTSWGSQEPVTEFLNWTLRLNPQLKHLSIPMSVWRTVQIVNQIRPDLESLEIQDMNYSGQDYRSATLSFPDMNILKYLTKSSRGMLMNPIPFEVENLEEIEFSQVDMNNHWVNIVLKNPNLKKISTHTQLNTGQLQRIDKELRNLESISFHYDVDMSRHNELVQFLLDDNIKIIKVSFKKGNNLNCNIFEQTLINSWEFDTYKSTSRVCTFIRKLKAMPQGIELHAARTDFWMEKYFCDALRKDFFIKFVEI